MTDSYDEDQLRFRNQHGGLSWDTVRSGARRIELRKRDAWLTKLFSDLTEPQQDAMVEIEIAFRSITSGVGMKNFDPQRVSGARHLPDSVRDAERVADYFAWGRELQKRKISHAMAMAIIAYGYTANQVDRQYRQKKGYGKENLIKSLAVFCELRGWPEN